MLILGIVAGVIFVALALGLMMSRRGGDTKLYESEAAWTQNTLPIHDTVANSMYGGAAPIFQQPLPQPAVNQCLNQSFSQLLNRLLQPPLHQEAYQPVGPWSNGSITASNILTDCSTEAIHPSLWLMLKS